MDQGAPSARGPWLRAAPGRRPRRATQTKRDDRETNRHEPTRWRLALVKPSRLAIRRPALRQLHRLRGSYHSRMTRTLVQAIAAAALVLVAVVGLILDGLRAAYYPAVTALLCGLSVLLQIRYPQSMKHWTRRRIIDTAAFIVLAAGSYSLVGGSS
jgi:hypothetical protein